MLRLKEDCRVFVANQAVDGRKSIDGLAAFVVEAFCGALKDGSVYVFYNKERNRVKCLLWDRNGFVLYQKRLERGRFKLSKGKNQGCTMISQAQLEWLLAGLDFDLMALFSELDYSQYF
jgi:transposase